MRTGCWGWSSRSSVAATSAVFTWLRPSGSSTCVSAASIPAAPHPTTNAAMPIRRAGMPSDASPIDSPPARHASAAATAPTSTAIGTATPSAEGTSPTTIASASAGLGTTSADATARAVTTRVPTTATTSTADSVDRSIALANAPAGLFTTYCIA